MDESHSAYGGEIGFRLPSKTRETKHKPEKHRVKLEPHEDTEILAGPAKRQRKNSVGSNRMQTAGSISTGE